MEAKPEKPLCPGVVCRCGKEEGFCPMHGINLKPWHLHNLADLRNPAYDGPDGIFTGYGEYDNES